VTLSTQLQENNNSTITTSVRGCNVIITKPESKHAKLVRKLFREHTQNKPAVLMP